MSLPDINISIDRGGTFCDVLVQTGQADRVFKLLSEDPANYRDAPTEAIRRALEAIEGRAIPKGEKIDGSRIASCRIGTTIATNALLQGKGEKFAFVTTKGFEDVCIIGDQTRPKLFDLKVRKATPLHEKVVGVDERVTVEDYDLDPFPLDRKRDIADPSLVRTNSGEIIRVLQQLDTAAVRETLLELKAEGYTSVAIAFLHSYLFPDHEEQTAAIAREIGFRYVTTSSEICPVIKYLDRSNSVCSEAFLYPIVKQYISDFEAGFSVLPQRVDFMCSDGGLRSASRFRGNEALLSGPAGGVVGIAQTCHDADEGTPVIGFDMGGTSTDVSRYDGTYDYLSQTTIAGRNITIPMLNIATVAAGGGSILAARNGLFVVGPESAGSHPGPACYRKGGPLTVTDANLFLGRLLLSSFPSIFGPNADQPLDYEATAQKFGEITKEINSQTGQSLAPEEVALGFLNVANETMSRPIRNATEARGYHPERHNLVSFGGAGGQHACSIAQRLGIKRILIHKYSSILSAVGISKTELKSDAVEPYVGAFDLSVLPNINSRFDSLKAKVRQDLLDQGAIPESIRFDESLSLRYQGTDTNLVIAKPHDEDYAGAFRSTHKREFAFTLERPVIVDSVQVRGAGGSSWDATSLSPFEALEQFKASPKSAQTQIHTRVFVESSWQDVPVYNLNSVSQSVIPGPALVIDATQTIFIEPQWQAYILSDHLVLERQANKSEPLPTQVESISPIQLSIFAHRFMAIAEQMGNTLQRTSISTSIKERLDFSCAIFSPSGKLVANAPHIPIHLGSMQYAIQYQHRLWQDKLQPGDVLLTNHPDCGGTHLPDLTIISPVFTASNTLAFYVAARGHHTDIGGRGISAMMPDSKELWEEGLNVQSMKVVENGVFLEADVREAFLHAGTFPGCSPTRRLNDNISDIKAQISSNQRGILLLQNLCDEFSLPVVHAHMHGIQSNAETAVRSFFKTIATDTKTKSKTLKAADYLDNGTRIQVSITIDSTTGSAVYDFTGTGPQTWTNYNCPISVTHSAVIYTTRCLIASDIPLNDGCLAPIEIIVPKGTALNPSAPVAICASTLASQRIIDTILRAFGAVAAFSGCANSFGWGVGGKDPLTGEIKPGWNYGETVGGGCGAGPGWDGESAVQCHSTNTKITDVEVVEKRTPVVVRRHAVRQGTGGSGRFRGGDGAIRVIEARVPMRCSILSDRRVFAPYGMQGGGEGAVGENYVYRWNGDRTGFDRVSVGGKAELKLDEGEMMEVNSPGGGGWG